MTIVDWSKFPNVKKLIDRIIEHRKVCECWRQRVPCPDCHFDTITDIEEELGMIK